MEARKGNPMSIRVSSPGPRRPGRRRSRKRVETLLDIVELRKDRFQDVETENDPPECEKEIMKEASLKMDADSTKDKIEEILADTDDSEPVSERMSQIPLVKLESESLTEDHLPGPAKVDRLTSVADNLSVARASSSSLSPFGSSILRSSDSTSGGAMSSSDQSRDVSSRLSFYMRERLHSFARDITLRTEKVKERIQRPPSADSISLASTVGEDNSGTTQEEKKVTMADFVPDLDGNEDTFKALESKDKNGRWACIDQQSYTYLIWSSVMCLCFIYNAFAIPLRASYPYQKPYLPLWLTLDYLCDIFYICDMIFFKPRIPFTKEGIKIKTKQAMRKHYLMGLRFKMDLVSIIPLDLLYFVPSLRFEPLLRLPRLLRFYTYGDTFYCIDNMIKNPYALRIAKTSGYMIYLIHCNSCIYYSISFWKGIGTNTWVYSGRGNAYIRCFYFTTKVASSIGNNPSPTNVVEHLYMTFAWMMGVFIFALLLGQIRDIVSTANRSKDEFRNTMDSVLLQLQKLKISKDVQEKVVQWFQYTWDTQKTLNETLLIEKLPRKLQTDLAISVHYETLSKVSLFQDCDKALLRNLVLKLEPVLFLPGDFVCRKGEVGKEMYIVNTGMVQVVGGPNNNTVFVTLKAGSVFGEISLLSIEGGDNRRTADVRSRGFSSLFVLSKKDLNEVLKDYPDAQKALKKKARKLMNKTKEREQEGQNKETNLEDECIVKSHDPKLIETVVKVLKPNTETARQLRKIMDIDQDELDRESICSSVFDSDIAQNIKDQLEAAAANELNLLEQDDQIDSEDDVEDANTVDRSDE